MQYSIWFETLDDYTSFSKGKYQVVDSPMCILRTSVESHFCNVEVLVKEKIRILLYSELLKLINGI